MSRDEVSIIENTKLFLQIKNNQSKPTKRLAFFIIYKLCQKSYLLSENHQSF